MSEPGMTEAQADARERFICAPLDDGDWMVMGLSEDRLEAGEASIYRNVCRVYDYRIARNIAKAMSATFSLPGAWSE